MNDTLKHIWIDLAKSADEIEFAPTDKKLVWPATNVCLYFKGPRLCVKLSLRGVQRIIGIFYNGQRAARFADAAHLFFVRAGVRRTGDATFNYSEELAASDLANNAPLTALLGEIISLIPPAAMSKAKPAKITLRQRLESLESQLKVLETRLAVLERARILRIQAIAKRDEEEEEKNAQLLEEVFGTHGQG